MATEEPLLPEEAASARIYEERFGVTPGKCHRSTNDGDSKSKECWLNAGNCDGTYEVAEPFEDGDNSDHMICPLTYIEDIRLGSCMHGGLGGSLTIMCSPNDESCPPSTTFIGPNDGATNNECTVGTTKFGSCGYGSGNHLGSCRFSPEDCPNGSAWIFPDPQCTCDKVQTGLCVFASNDDDEDVHNTICAVNKEACGGSTEEDTHFFEANEVREKFGFDCYLCGDHLNPPPKVALPSETTAPEQEFIVTASPTQDPQKEDEWKNLMDEAKQEAEEDAENSTGGSGGAIVALLVIGITAALVLYLVSIFLRKRKRRERQRQQVKEILEGELSHMDTDSTEEEEDESSSSPEDGTPVPVPHQEYYNKGRMTRRDDDDDVEDYEDFPEDYEDYPQQVFPPSMAAMTMTMAGLQQQQQQQQMLTSEYNQADLSMMSQEDQDQAFIQDESMMDIYQDDEEDSAVQEEMMYEDFPHDEGEEPYDETDTNSIPSIV